MVTGSRDGVEEGRGVVVEVGNVRVAAVGSVVVDDPTVVVLRFDEDGTPVVATGRVAAASSFDPQATAIKTATAAAAK